MNFEDAKAALVAFDDDRFNAFVRGIWRPHERNIVRQALVEYIERHKPYVPPPPPPSIYEQFEMVRTKYPTATITKHERRGCGHLVTITDWHLPPGYDRDACTVYFHVPEGYPYAPPDRFYTSELLMAHGGHPYMTRPLVTKPYESHGYTWSPEGLETFPAPDGSMLWFWKLQDWRPGRDTLKSYVSVIKRRLDDVNAAPPPPDWD